jgi:hypothetical protein
VAKFSQIPHAKKSSKQAKLQRVGQTTFGSSKVQSAISDNVSEYDLSEDEEGGTLDSITTMQQLYSVFCPRHLIPQVKSTKHENGVSHLIIFGIQHCCDVLYQKVKRQKSSNQSVVYRGDSCTSQWRQKKKWKKAANGTMKLGGFLVVSGPYQIDMFRKLTSAFCSRNGHAHHLPTRI